MGDDLLESLIRRPLDNPGAPPPASVPCGSCRRCCQKNSMVMLLAQEGDVIESYEHEVINLPGVGAGPVLKRKPNGDCVYLGEAGCTIHDRAPVICKTFDCRGAYLAFMDHPRNERRRMLKAGMIDGEILDAGKTLLAGERR